MLVSARRLIALVLIGLGVIFPAGPSAQAPAADAQLLAAAGSGNAAAITAALAQGGDINARNGRGATALYIACERGNAEIVKLLLDHGADPDAKDLEWGRTPLRHASMGARDPKEKEARASILRLLIEKGAGSEGESLNDLIRSGHIAEAKTIISRGKADPSYLNLALAAAKRAQQPELRDALVAAGATDPTPVDMPRSPERLKLWFGTYRDAGGANLIVRPSIQDDQVLIEVAGQRPVALVPLDATTLRSMDLKKVVTRVAARMPPSTITFTDRGRAVVFTRIGDAPATVMPARTEMPAARDRVALPAPVSAPVRAETANWPSFRGTSAAGIADAARTPVTWDVERGVNVKWKTRIPGLAHSSPIVWGNRVFVTTAIPSNESSMIFRHGEAANTNVEASNRSTRDDVSYAWRVYALDKRTGKILWDRLAHEGVPTTQRQVSQSQANSTPATDGKHLIVWFGSEGLYCYDLDGKLLWQRDLGPMRSGYIVDPSYEWNTASSPVIYKNRVILQVDLLEDSFIAAFDVETGRDVWRTSRDEVPSWATPFIYEGPPRTELITLAPTFARGYDPETGRELWRLGKHSIYSSPTPIAGDGLIFITSGGGNSLQPIYAIRPGGSGDITPGDDETSSEFVPWRKLRGGSTLATPVAYRGLLYVCTDTGILSAYRIDTGERLYQERLTRGGSYAASGVAADGKLYFANEDGAVIVVKAGPHFERLAENPMGQVILATPAISGDSIIFRMQHDVVAIADATTARE